MLSSLPVVRDADPRPLTWRPRVRARPPPPSSLGHARLGRLHSRRAPAGAEADHRAALGARARGRGDGPRLRADRGAPRAARHPATSRSARHGGASTAAQGDWRSRRAAPRSARWARPRRFDLALAHGSVDLAVVSTLLRIPWCRCRTTSTPGCSASSPSGPRGGCSCPTRSRSRRCERAGAARAQALPLPGPEGGLLPRRLHARPGGARASSGLDRGRAVLRRRPAAARDLRLPRRQPALRGGARAPGSPSRRATTVVIPRTEAQAGGGRAAPAATVARADRARAGDRRAEPDRLRRPRGQRRRDDEPRGGGPRHARLHDLQRPDGRRGRAADRRGPCCASSRDAAELELRKRTAAGRGPAPARPAAAGRRRARRARPECRPGPRWPRPAETRRPCSYMEGRAIAPSSRSFAAALAWMLVPIAERIALADRGDRRAQRAQPPHGADARSSAAWRSSSAVLVAGVIFLPMGAADPRRSWPAPPRSRPSASSTTSSSCRRCRSCWARSAARPDPGLQRRHASTPSRCRSSAASTRARSSSSRCRRVGTWTSGTC